jgi:phage tail sheath protein FI
VRADYVSSAGAVDITVVTPPLAPSRPARFTVSDANPSPIITSISPASALVASGDLTLTINGGNFVPDSVVNWNGAALDTQYVGPSQLTATAPGANLVSAAKAVVTVTNKANDFGLIFTALEMTDAVPMTVTIANVRDSGATFDVVITYGSVVESYRGVQLAGSAVPDKAIKNSALVTVKAATSGYGSSISAQRLPITYTPLSTVANCLSAADFITGDGSTLSVFDANGPLDNLEFINLLLVPGVTDFSVVSAALAFAERKRAFAILDAPLQAPAFGSSNDHPQPIQYWMEGLGGAGPSLPLSQNGAIYFPYLISADPITGRNIPMAPSGFVAGVYAQTDASRGVWKAPAGLAPTVLNTAGPVLSGIMNDPQQGTLNLDSINCLRQFSGQGTVIWGARTLVAANDAYQQSKYVPVRRMTLFIEQTLVARLRWVVFEPNDTPLWIAITNSIESFMLSLFRQGALQGTQPSQAFQVKCDATTTSPDDQQNGVVNIVVAFAPLKPAEFVVIKIAQLAGQTAGS